MNCEMTLKTDSFFQICISLIPSSFSLAEYLLRIKFLIVDNWIMRLAKFYINFYKKIYRHTDWDRSYEASEPSDWNVQASSDFGLLVPD
ncbi:hypothetical protein CRM79_21425 [Pantoea agglomerans]|nr:hypothetical protein CRM79_21425 [Pantoea agglomerans]